MYKTKTHVASIENSNESQTMSTQRLEDVCKATQDKLILLQKKIDMQKQEMMKYQNELKDKDNEE